jgi:hypothetical protein
LVYLPFAAALRLAAGLLPLQCAVALAATLCLCFISPFVIMITQMLDLRHVWRKICSNESNTIEYEHFQAGFRAKNASILRRRK